MSSNSIYRCAAGDNLCVIRVYEQEVIIVPVLLLMASAVTLLTVCLLRGCPSCRGPRGPRAVAPRNPDHDPERSSNQRSDRGRYLRGIDAPAELNAMEHEVVQLRPVQQGPVQQGPVQQGPVQQGPLLGPAVPPPSSEWQHGAFSQMCALPQGFSIRPGNAVRYRAQMGRTPVVLRVLRDTADSGEKEHFLGFASFLSGLGPHPFLPMLVGVVSVAPPLMMVMEELQHRDLLDFLWRCRQESSSAELPHDLTEKRIFTMAGQVASALEFLHGRGCIHGKVGARSVLIGRDLTAKLWGLGPAFRRARRLTSPWEPEDTDTRKWQAPEVLAMRDVTQSSDTWSLGVLLFEMASLGEAPFAEVPASELLQQLQRGKTLRRPAHCSNALNSLIRSCCQFAPQQRPSLAQLIKKLRSGETSANGQTALRAPEPMGVERYLREAGYGEAHIYAVM
ncbi:unnamed protein product [Lota lota]